MTVTIDTNILLHLLRGSYLVPVIRKKLEHLEAENTIVLSVFSIAEIESIAHKQNYGRKKRDYLKKLIKDFLVVPVASLDLVDRYAEVDAYSQGRLTGNPLPEGFSSRNMGKNDLWITATASVMNSALITIDKDFEHLDRVYLDYVFIDSEQ